VPVSTFQIETSKGRGGNRYLPYAFTEQGVAMLSRNAVIPCLRQSQLFFNIFEFGDQFDISYIYFLPLVTLSPALLIIDHFKAKSMKQSRFSGLLFYSMVFFLASCLRIGTGLLMSQFER